MEHDWDSIADEQLGEDGTDSGDEGEPAELPAETFWTRDDMRDLGKVQQRINKVFGERPRLHSAYHYSAQDDEDLRARLLPMRNDESGLSPI